MIAKSLKTFQINCKKVKMNRYKFGMVALILFCSSPLALFTGTTIFLSVKNIEIPDRININLNNIFSSLRNRIDCFFI